MNKKIAVVLYTLRNVKRFNGRNHPSKRRQDYATHGFNSLAISSVIGTKYNLNHSDNVINLERVYGKIIFGALHPSFFGDVPKLIQEQYPDLAMAFKLAKQTNGEKLVLDFSESYKDRFTDYIVNSKDDTVEGEIVKQSENISVLMKCEEELKAVSNRYFKKLKVLIKDHVVSGLPLIISQEIIDELQDEKYDNLIHEGFFDIYLNTIKDILKSNLEEIKWYFKEVYFSPFTLIINNFQEVLRWNNNNCEDDTDSQHSFFVAMWCFILGLIQINSYETKIDIARMIGKAIFHDIHESLSSDILSYIKRINPKVKQLIDMVENDKNDIVLSLLPEELHPIFKDYICDPKTDDPEGHLVHIADKIDATIKSLNEIKLKQTKYFIEAYDKGMQEIMNEANHYLSIKDFCTFMLHEFHRS